MKQKLPKCVKEMLQTNIIKFKHGIKDDEKEFLVDVYVYCKSYYKPDRREGISPRELINKSKINHKRAWYLLDKWFQKDWYICGVSVDLGQLTESGIEKAKEIMEELLKGKDDINE